MADEFEIDDYDRRMKGAVSVLGDEFAGLRTGRASTAMLEPITVDAYGQKMPLAQVGTISVPEPRLLTIQVWDKSQVSAAEKAIRESNLGLNPQTDGQLIRIPVPELNEERRQELTKVAAQYAEQARVAVRNVRRDAMETLKSLERDKNMSEDEHKAWNDEIQNMTDARIKEIDAALEAKDAEIMQV